MTSHASGGIGHSCHTSRCNPCSHIGRRESVFVSYRPRSQGLVSNSDVTSKHFLLQPLDLFLHDGQDTVLGDEDLARVEAKITGHL